LLLKKFFYNKFNHDPNRIKWNLNISSNYPYVSNTSRLAVQVSWDTATDVVDFTSAQNSDASSVNSGTVGVVLDSNGPNVGVALWVSNVSVSCPSGSSESVGVYRTIVYQDSNSWNETLPSGDPDGLDLSVRVSFFSFLSNCPTPSIYWDPEIGGSSSAVGLVASLLTVFVIISIFPFVILLFLLFLLCNLFFLPSFLTFLLSIFLCLLIPRSYF